MDNDSPGILSGDRPGTDPERDDGLGYAPFAKHLARAILSMTPTEGLVAAVYAPWGAGKTTLLNFVEHYLGTESGDNPPVVVHFNPWWFSGDENLARHFFDQLRAAMDSDTAKVGEDVRKKVAGFADAVSEMPITKLLGFFGKTTGLPLNIEEIAKFAAKFLKEEQKDVSSLKRQATDALRKQGRKILVVIDDIDRLTAEETRQLFRVVKAVADFPYVVYLLAFDKEVAIKALSESQGVPGEAYLEKIVQVPFELPLPDRTSLRRLLFGKLDLILSGTDDSLFDQAYWVNAYQEGVDPFIETPRDIVRLTNSIGVTYPAVKGDVNPVDFICIEAMRIFLPGVYDVVRRNGEMFAGYADMAGHRDERLKPFHDAWLGEVAAGEREAAQALVRRLFPRLNSVWGNTYYGSESASGWRRQLRVCSPEIFPAYFRLALPEGTIPNSEMKAALATLSQKQGFADLLVSLSAERRPDGTTRARALLERLEDYTEKDIQEEDIAQVIRALADAGDAVSLAERGVDRGMFDFGVEMHIGRIMWQLLKRLDEPARFEVLRAAFAEGRSVGTIAREIAVLGQQHGKFGGSGQTPEGERILSAAHLADLEKIGLERIVRAAADGTLVADPMLGGTIYSWREWGGSQQAADWFAETVSSDEGLLRILESFLGRKHRQSMGSSFVRTTFCLNPSSFAPYMDIESLTKRVVEVGARKDLTEMQRIAVDQYLSEEKLLAQE